MLLIFYALPNNCIRTFNKTTGLLTLELFKLEKKRGIAKKGGSETLKEKKALHLIINSTLSLLSFSHETRNLNLYIF